MAILKKKIKTEKEREEEEKKKNKPAFASVKKKFKGIKTNDKGK